jgi:hypothetical protein
MLETYGFISLPANNYATIPTSSLDNNNPTEFSETNYDLMRYNDNLRKPFIGGALQLAADHAYTIPALSQLTENPTEFMKGDRTFHRIIYEDIGFNQNPNAFRQSFSLNQETTIPRDIPKQDQENVRVSDRLRRGIVREQVETKNDNYLSSKEDYLARRY